MHKINHALTMLSAAGGVLAVVPTAQAVTLHGAFNGPAGYSETFTLQSDGGVASAAGSHYTDFALSNDSLGNTVATVGDNTTGVKAEVFGAPIDSYFGTGTGTIGSGQTPDSVAPALYTAGSTPVLTPGTYTGEILGYTLTLSAAPEPDAWALLIAGAALVGGAVRGSRRRGVATA